MQRDKRGRFVKKATTGTNLTFSLNQPLTSTIGTWGTQNFIGADAHIQAIRSGIPNSIRKIKYGKTADGKRVDEYGNDVEGLVLFNPDLYEFDDKGTYELKTFGTNAAETNVTAGVGTQETPGEEESAGRNLPDPNKKTKKKSPLNLAPINKTKLANYLDFAKAGLGASVNNKLAERALKAEKPFLQDVSESHRTIYGDYRAKLQGEQAAAQLRNMASKPMTSDGALQQQMMLDAQIKGQSYIDQGNAKDDAMIRQTGEVAWQQDKENRQQRQAVAMQNRQSMLMTEKNKANIENMRDSANFSQIVEPLLTSFTQNIRQQGAKQDAYNDYYREATIPNEVWSTFHDDLTPEEKSLAQKFVVGGVEGVRDYIGTDVWNNLQKRMNNEIIRRQALLRGVALPTQQQKSLNNPHAYWEPNTSLLKKGGTVYKAKLNKRTKDNDRTARSIDSSKKIAAKFLEKTMGSLYGYGDIDIIAKPRKSRKYQKGGGIPFVGITPTFGTSEKGAPKLSTSSKSDKDELTTKDLLTLLKDLDGLPSDMHMIEESMRTFTLQDQMDPFGISSSSNIASRYVSLVSKIKNAKFQREEYNNAFNQLKGNGGLNELAVTSEGLFIGANASGDFEYFTPDQVNSGKPQQDGYSLLTNSNLLYMRANSPTAAFQHRLTTFAQNGIGMEVITKQISDIIQGLGSTKEGEEGFVKMGAHGQVKEGLKFLQKAIQAVGDSTVAENMSVADYYHTGYLTEDQANQAQLALNYIYSALPANARALLQVKGGSAKGAEAIIQSLVFSKTKSDTQFKASPKKMTKSGGSGSGNSDGVDKLKLSPVQMMQVGYTDHQDVVLQKGTKYATKVRAQVVPITDANKKLLGVTTLDQVASSTFGGALDMNNVTMGSQLIDPHAMQNVQIDSTNLYVMNLPIDRSSMDGTIRPDLSWMKKIEEIDSVIREKGITDVQQINALYVEAGLPVLLDANGQLNIQDYCKFGVLNGHALNSAFKNLDLLDNTVVEIEDEDQINNVMSILNKGRGEKDRLDFDSKSWADSLFGTDHDSIYEGTIYIPIRTNAFTGMIGGGQYPDTETAAEVEALVQQQERTRGYVDPGLLN